MRPEEDEEEWMPDPECLLMRCEVKMYNVQCTVLAILALGNSTPNFKIFFKVCRWCLRSHCIILLVVDYADTMSA